MCYVASEVYEIELRIIMTQSCKQQRMAPCSLTPISLIAYHYMHQYCMDNCMHDILLKAKQIHEQDNCPEMNCMNAGWRN